jgi:hypothetical protein
MLKHNHLLASLHTRCHRRHGFCTAIGLVSLSKTAIQRIIMPYCVLFPIYHETNVFSRRTIQKSSNIPLSSHEIKHLHLATIDLNIVYSQYLSEHFTSSSLATIKAYPECNILPIEIVPQYYVISKFLSYTDILVRVALSTRQPIIMPKVYITSFPSARIPFVNP